VAAFEPKDRAMALNQSLGLGNLIFYGTGTILGAGIFVVIGEVIGEAGVFAPFAYLAAALVAFTTALSFAELGARYPDAGGPVEYTDQAFGGRFLPDTCGWLLIAANVVSAATIVTGFVSYLNSFANVAHWIATLGLVATVTLVAAIGIKQSAWFMTVTTLIGIATLLFILWATRDNLVASPTEIMSAELNLDASSGILAGAFLAIYSFIGFGDMVQTAEEVKDVEKTLPRAMIISLIIVFMFYIMISLALVGSGRVDQIADAKAPLVEAVGDVGMPMLPVAIASLFVIVNGSLAQIVAASRMMMDMARDDRGGMPTVMQKVDDRTSTPMAATIVSGAAVLGLALFFPLKTLASGTSVAILLVFTAVNAALWRLKRTRQTDDLLSIWRIVPVLGTLFCALAIVGQIILWLI
jgi:basic amino acid/polyamine antiporter, APA family